jgi:hypothetical protein
MMKSIGLILAGIVMTSKAAGLDFIMVGDFGWTLNMTNSELNFDAIDRFVGDLSALGVST